MPLAPLDQAQANLTIPVAGGCGAGFHRGRYGRCVRTAPVAATGVVVAPRVAPACRRVCNRYGCRRGFLPTIKMIVASPFGGPFTTIVCDGRPKVAIRITGRRSPGLGGSFGLRPC